MTPLNLQEIHDLLVKLAHEAGALMLEASLASSPQVHTSKKNSKSLRPSSTLLAPQMIGAVNAASTQSRRSRHANRPSNRNKSLLNSPPSLPQFRFHGRRNLRFKRNAEID
jgi:hypothetical protein